MKINYTLLIKAAFFALLLINVNTKMAFPEIINKIEVNGNDRLAKETIILFSELNVNDNVNSEDLNTAFKKLYDTDYFKDIKINLNNGNLSIEVIENPLIQSIIINGIDKQSIVDELQKITKKIEKYPYLENNINDQQNTLLNIVRNIGFYFAQIETRIEDNNNNSVNIIYNFILGERAEISEIKFIGNKIFRNNKLRNIIISEESKPWKFLSSNKYLNENRINIDVSKIRVIFSLN